MGLRGQWKKQKTEQKTGQANKFINSNQIRENSQVEKNPFGNKKDGLKDGSNLYKGREQELCYIDFRACDLRKARGHSFGNAINQLRLYSEKPAKKIFLMGDLHIPYHDKKALLTALLYAVQEVKPDWLVILGDLLDFKGMSSYLKDIRERDLTKELIESAEILKTITELFAGVEKIIYIEGNHEERLYSYIYKNAPELSGIFKNPLSLFKTIQSELGHEIFNDKIKYHTPRESAQPYYPLVGRRLLAIHGHEYHKGSKYGVINVARNILEKAKKSIIFGHWHITQEYTSTAIDRDLRSAWAVGCLSNLTPDWNPLNQWNHGFAIVYVYADGFFTVLNKKIINKGERLVIV